MRTNLPQSGFELAQNPGPDFIERNCAYNTTAWQADFLILRLTSVH